jgi:hypothetical protein
MLSYLFMTVYTIDLMCVQSRNVMLAAEHMVLKLQEEQASLKTSLDMHVAAQRRVEEYMKERDVKKDEQIQQLIGGLNAELEATRSALKTAHETLENYDIRTKVGKHGLASYKADLVLNRRKWIKQ